MNSTEGFPYNRDWRRRNQILEGHFRTEPPFDGLNPEKGYGHFHNLPVEKAEQLLQERFMNPEEHQDYSPPAHVFVDFMKRFPGVTAHGYLIGPDREDYRVTIEGIAYQGAISDEMRQDAKRLFGNADDCVLEEETLYVWYD